MDRKYLLISMLAVTASFIGGFFIANSLNRTEMSKLRMDNEQLRSAVAEKPDTQSDASISDDELRAKIAEADRNPTNFEYQKNLGLALYRYAAMKNDNSLLKESARILDRAFDLKKDDFDVLVGRGNAHFDIGYFGKDNSELAASREIYNKAIAIRPADVEVRTDLGLTYFLSDPPDDARAVAEFQTSLKIDPKHAKSLEFIIQSLIRQKNFTEADKYLGQLRSADPSNDTLTGLETRLAEARNSQQK